MSEPTGEAEDDWTPVNPFEDDPKVEWFFSGEEVDPSAFPTTEDADTRRGILVGLVIAFVALFLLQMGFAAMASETLWERITPYLIAASTLVNTGFGFAFGYYFARKD